MHPKETDRSSKRRVEPPPTAAADPAGLDPDVIDGFPGIEAIEEIEQTIEHAAEATLRAAFDRFFDFWFDRVYTFALRLGRDSTDAETLTTLIFMKALHLLPRGSKGAPELAHRLAAAGARQASGEPSSVPPDCKASRPRRNGRAR